MKNRHVLLGECLILMLRMLCCSLYLIRTKHDLFILNCFEQFEGWKRWHLCGRSRATQPRFATSTSRVIQTTIPTSRVIQTTIPTSRVIQTTIPTSRVIQTTIPPTLVSQLK